MGRRGHAVGSTDGGVRERVPDRRHQVVDGPFEFLNERGGDAMRTRRQRDRRRLQEHARGRLFVHQWIDVEKGHALAVHRDFDLLGVARGQPVEKARRGAMELNFEDVLAVGGEDVVEPLSPARYLVQFTASAELRNKLERLTALMPGNDLASIVEAAVTEKLDRIEAKRFGKTKKPRKSLEDSDTSPGVRGIAAAVRRFVWERDGGQCTFKAADGTRCTARDRIHFHHDEPYGLGGDRGPENIKLMCATHNGYMAELDYGKEKMDQYRRSGDRVREPSPTFHPSRRSSRSWRSVELGPPAVSQQPGAVDPLSSKK